MGVRYQVVVDCVVFAGSLATHALAAAVLPAISLGGDTFDVAALAQGDNDLLVGDEVFIAEVTGFLRGDFSATLVAELLLELLGLVGHDLQDFGRVGKEGLELRDALVKLLELVLYALALKGGQTAELHFKDGLGLLLIKGCISP